MDTLERLAKRVGRQPTDTDFRQAWASLEAEDYRVDDLTTAGEFSACAALLRERLAARTLRGKPERAPAWIRHAFVLADHAAEAVTQDPAVQAFRAEVLHGVTLQASAVPRWLRARAGQFHGLATLLAFQDGEELRRIPVTGNADLERLQALVHQLVHQHQWSEDTATAFVLTAQTPLRWPIRVQARTTRTGITADSAGREQQSVSLVIDAWVPAIAVAAAYRHARRTLRRQASRTPRVSLRRRALAAFVLAHPHVTARTRLHEWNATHPTWRYGDVRNFVRDSRRAVARLA